MGKPAKRSDDDWAPRRPAISREARQASMENLALDLVEQRLRDGTASSQETTHFLKSASTRGRIEERRLEHEIELMRAKKSHLESQEQLQNMFAEAMEKMGNYRYEEPGDDEPPALRSVG